MTKGGSGKSKTLGRLIFGDKRKQHASPARHRSSTRNGPKAETPADLSASAGPAAPTTAAPAPPKTKKKSINLHDWSVWRMQLNEQLATILAEHQGDLQSLRQFLQTSPFYQQQNRDQNRDRLLFSIPRAKFRPEYIEEFIVPNPPDIPEPVAYEPSHLASHSDDRTCTSPNSISATQGKGLSSHPLEGIRMRSTAPRSSYIATDRVHSTLQKAVKDGNVLEKIKAFEMQAAAAAAAQAESSAKQSTTSSTMNSRIQSVTSSIQSAAHRTLSPGVVHPISPMPMNMYQQNCQAVRDHRCIPSTEMRRDATIERGTRQPAKKSSHALDPDNGDIILKRRTPSPMATREEEDCSITAISSMAVRSSKEHRRTNPSRSRHRTEINYEKRSSSRNDHRQKRTTTPRRRGLKARKDTSNAIEPSSVDKQEITIIKKNSSKKKQQEDNNRVYGVPSPQDDSLQTAAKIESDEEQQEQTNTYVSPKEGDKRGEKLILATLQRRSMRKHPMKFSSTDGEILSKADDDDRMTQTIDRQADQSASDDEDGSDGNVFLEDAPIVGKSTLPRRHPPQESSGTLRRHASQRSAEEYRLDRRLHRAKETIETIPSQTLKKSSSPITILTRKSRSNHREEDSSLPVNDVELSKKKQRPSQTASNQPNKQISKQILHAIMNSMNHTNQQQDLPISNHSVNDEFFDNGPLTNPEETLAQINNMK